MESVLDMKGRTLSGRDDRILVPAISRSGSSWLIGALGATPGTERWYEPDNIDADPSGQGEVGKSGFGPYPMIRPGEDGGVYRSLWDVVYKGALPYDFSTRLIPIARPLLKLPPSVLHPLVRLGSRALTSMQIGKRRIAAKSVYACFCLEWLVSQYDPKVVMIQRHPLSIAASWRELGIPFFDLATRPELLELYGDRYEGDPPSEEDSLMSRIAWHIGLLNMALGDALDRNSGWMLVNHEDLCIDPEAKFKALCEILGLQWSENVAAYLKASNRPGTGLTPVRVTSEQVKRWKGRLTDEDMNEVLTVLSRFPRNGWIREPN
ncbi:MAG: hypothetical protein ACP5PJ_01870 [Acidimicrobiales bacterium]